VWDEVLPFGRILLRWKVWRLRANRHELPSHALPLKAQRQGWHEQLGPQATVGFLVPALHVAVQAWRPHVTEAESQGCMVPMQETPQISLPQMRRSVLQLEPPVHCKLQAVALPQTTTASLQLWSPAHVISQAKPSGHCIVCVLHCWLALHVTRQTPPTQPPLQREGHGPPGGG
jgi:hypothetical protein